jgi:integrase
MARIRKHRNKWQVLYRDPATKKERSAGVFTRKSDATKQRRAIEYRLQTGEWIDPRLQETLYVDWATAWIEARSDLKPKTLDGYQSLLRSRVLPMFGEVRLRDIRAADIERWVANMANEPLSPSRIRQAYSVLSASLKAAVRNDMIRSNPAEGVKLPKMTINEMRHLTPAEVEMIASRVGDDYEVLVYVLAYCAIRAGEAVALTRQNVNIVRRELRIVESATEINGHIRFGATKNRRNRNVTVPRFLMKLMEDHLERYVGEEPDALVFGSPHREPLRLSNFRHRVWYPALKGTDLEGVRIHDLRHTGASILINQGLHPKIVQQHLGHSSIVVTMDRYGHLYPSDNERVQDALDAAFETGLVGSNMPRIKTEADQMQTGA